MGYIVGEGGGGLVPLHHGMKKGPVPLHQGMGKREGSGRNSSRDVGRWGGGQSPIASWDRIHVPTPPSVYKLRAVIIAQMTMD